MGKGRVTIPTEGEEVSHITCDLCTGMGYDLCIASAFPDIC